MGHLPHPGQRRQVRHAPENRQQTTNNPNSLRCIQVIAGVLGRAGEAGQKQRLASAAQGHITYRPSTGLTVPESEDDAAAAKQQRDKEIALATAQLRVGGAAAAEVDQDAELERHLDN